MEKPKNVWPTTPTGRAILFVAQIMHELLDSKRSPSFRVKTMDSIELIKEVVRVCVDVEAAGVDHRNAESVIMECLEVLELDVVAATKYKYEIEAFRHVYQELREKKRSLQDVVHHANFFIGNLRPSYKSDLENYILDNLLLETEWPKLRAALSSYLSYLINHGYSREYLFSRVEDRFFSKDIKKADRRSISRFFGEFSGDSRDFFGLGVGAKDDGELHQKIGCGMA